MAQELGHCQCKRINDVVGGTIPCRATPTSEDLLCDFCRTFECGVASFNGEQVDEHVIIKFPSASSVQVQWSKPKDLPWVKDAVDKAFPRKYLNDTVMGMPVRIDPNLPPPGWRIEGG